MTITQYETTQKISEIKWPQKFQRHQPYTKQNGLQNLKDKYLLNIYENKMVQKV